MLGIIKTVNLPLENVDGVLGLSPSINSDSKAELLIDELFN